VAFNYYSGSGVCLAVAYRNMVCLVLMVVPRTRRGQRCTYLGL